jgi:2-polyprenyl-6-hydroxyphenyl methylase/3-demethylubiquinone-9 3-methyltransferase
MATLNRTAKAFALAIVGAEHVLRWLPVGTHDWSKFVTPDEARSALDKAGLAVDQPVGVSFSPLSGRWSLGSDAAVNYMMVARKAT